jgi:hypothetical protein
MNYQLNSFVNQHEADALKNMIFKRVRERSQAMTEDLQADIMNIARESFVSSNNPFSSMIKAESHAEIASKTSEPVTPSVVETEKAETTGITKADNNKNEQGVGFPQKQLYSGAITQNKIIKEQLTASQIQNNMIEAREGLSGKQSFMGALAFLNSQAAVSLLRTRADKFEAIA